MTKKLFDGFEPISSKQWKQKIQYELKGADYNDTLIWNSNEGIAVKPFYHADDIESISSVSQSSATTWKICEKIIVEDVERANNQALKAIKGGAESLWFVINSANVSVAQLLENIVSQETQLHFECYFLSPQYSISITDKILGNDVFIHNDIIGNLAKTGNWRVDLRLDFSNFQEILEKTSSITIDTTMYQNAGAHMIQQLAYALSHANEYLNYCEQQKSTHNIKQTIFKVSVGTNYFFEIAKLRALRKLWTALAKEYNLNEECHIIAAPTKRNKTIYDYNTNMLRTTTECMSAILGGANTICNLAYDALYHKSNDFGDRIARNQLLILRHESYFDKVVNPSDGAYYIETLTDQLADKALTLFKDIEANGGFLKQLKDGTIQRKIKESALKEQMQFNEGNEILVGSNKYPNPKDKMKEELEISPFTEKQYRKTLIEPITEKRLAEKLENQRLKTEN